MTAPRFMINSDPEAPVLEGTQLADTRNIPPAERQRLKVRARAAHDVLMAALRWSKAFDYWVESPMKDGQVDPRKYEDQALVHGRALAALRDAVRDCEEAARG